MKIVLIIRDKNDLIIMKDLIEKLLNSPNINHNDIIIEVKFHNIRRDIF